MWTPDYFVRSVPLPLSVKGVTIPNNDGSFDIYINSLLPDDTRKRTLQHEINHVINDHFYSDKDLSILESEANGLIPPSPAAEHLNRPAPLLPDTDYAPPLSDNSSLNNPSWPISDIPHLRPGFIISFSSLDSLAACLENWGLQDKINSGAFLTSSDTED